MVNLDDASRFTKVLNLTVPWAHSYADTRPGKTDLERRERYRSAASGKFLSAPKAPLWWAFRISVLKAGRPLDVDNIAKTVIDSFSASQINRDGSSHTDLILYQDDTFNEVRILQVVGEPSSTGKDSTTIEVFACIA